MNLEKMLREALVNFVNSEEAKEVAEKNDKVAKEIDTIRETVDDNIPILLVAILFPQILMSAIVWAITEENKSNRENGEDK